MKRVVMWAMLAVMVMGPAIVRIAENGPKVS